MLVWWSACLLLSLIHSVSVVNAIIRLNTLLVSRGQLTLHWSLGQASSLRHGSVHASLVLGDQHHHSHAEQQGQDLQQRLPETGAAHQQLWEHGDGGDVDEAPGREGQDPGGGRGSHSFSQQRADGSGQSADRGQQL